MPARKNAHRSTTRYTEGLEDGLVVVARLQGSARSVEGSQIANRVVRLTAEDFLRLYDEYYEKVFRYILYRCGEQQTAEDLTAHVFMRALDRLEQYRSERAPIGAWLFAIARNLVSDTLRVQSRKAYLPLEKAGDRRDETPSPEEHLLRTEQQLQLVEALAALDERERDLLSLKFGARLTNRRIAALLKMSESNVAVIVYRALRRLRALMTGE